MNGGGASSADPDDHERDHANENHGEVDVDSVQRQLEIAKLWHDLGSGEGKDELNFKEFKRGLKKTDHCLKHANKLITELFCAVDSDQDGKIKFQEFQDFLRRTEVELRKLFDDIDKEKNGHLDKAELRKAFKSAGLTVGKKKLDAFFDKIDTDNDGVISFEEWRDFLLFLPDCHSDLHSVLSYFNATGTLDPEGDVHINQPSHGLGTAATACASPSASTVAAAPNSTATTITTTSTLLDDVEKLASNYLQSLVHFLHNLQEPLFLSIRAELGGFMPPSVTTYTSASTSTTTSPSSSSARPLPSSIFLPPELRDQTSAQTKTITATPLLLNPELDLDLDPTSLDPPVPRLRIPTAEAAADDDDDDDDDDDGDDIDDIPVLPLPSWPYALLLTAFTYLHSPFSLLHTLSIPVLTTHFPHLGYFLAGGIAGAVSRTATAPLDRLKVYLIAQTGKQKAKLGKSGQGGGQVAKEIVKGGPRVVFQRIVSPFTVAVRELWKAGGWRSLFAGNGLNVVKVMPESAIKFGAYEASKRALSRLEGHGDSKKLQPGSQFVAGGLGGMTSQCFVYPLDTLKFRMQCETVEGGLHGNRLIAATLRNMWASNGIYSFYRGLPLGLVGVFPYAAIDLFTFETLKRTTVAAQAKKLHVKESDVILSNFTTGAIGAFSGALGASMVYPMNVLRTRLQMQGTVLHRMTYDGIVDVARKTYNAEGARGFFKGLTPNLMKVIPAVSISYVVYENSKRLLKLS